MNFKYKELRIVGFLIVIIAGILGRMATALMNGEKKILILGLLVLFSAFYILLGKYSSKVGEDYLLVYEFKLIGILPAMIEFKDIEKIEASKHIVYITHHHKVSKCYMWDAPAFLSEYLEKSTRENN